MTHSHLKLVLTKLITRGQLCTASELNMFVTKMFLYLKKQNIIVKETSTYFYFTKSYTCINRSRSCAGSQT